MSVFNNDTHINYRLMPCGSFVVAEHHLISTVSLLSRRQSQISIRYWRSSINKEWFLGRLGSGCLRRFSSGFPVSPGVIFSLDDSHHTALVVYSHKPSPNCHFQWEIRHLMFKGMYLSVWQVADTIWWYIDRVFVFGSVLTDVFPFRHGMMYIVRKLTTTFVRG